MSNKCCFCKSTDFQDGETATLILNDKDGWFEFCMPCGSKEVLTNRATGETKTFIEVFNMNRPAEEQLQAVEVEADEEIHKQPFEGKHYMIANFRDFHKDTYGFRPSEDTENWFNSLDQEAMQKEWERMGEVFRANEKEEKDLQAKAVESFNTLVKNMFEFGAKTRTQAIEWLMDAEDIFAPSSQDYGDYFCFINNLPYSFEKEFNTIIFNKRKRMRGV